MTPRSRPELRPAGSRNLRANLKAALVTGAAGGIGAAIVRRLETDGWSVHGVDIADGNLATREGSNVVDGALERFGRLDAVVANAGLQHVARWRSSRRSAGTRCSRCC